MKLTFWEPFIEQLPSTHVKDVASAVFTVFKAALEGRAEEGEEGICKSPRSRLTGALLDAAL